MDKQNNNEASSADGSEYQNNSEDYIPSSACADDIATLHDSIVDAIKGVYDPEIPVNLYDLGLIYNIDISDDYDVNIDMTLTTPGCPVAGEMPGMVASAVEPVPGVRTVDVKLVWDPPWDISRMTEEARLELGML